jgi:hypothetical protein
MRRSEPNPSCWKWRAESSSTSTQSSGLGGTKARLPRTANWPSQVDTPERGSNHDAMIMRPGELGQVDGHRLAAAAVDEGVAAGTSLRAVGAARGAGCGQDQ